MLKHCSCTLVCLLFIVVCGNCQTTYSVAGSEMYIPTSADTIAAKRAAHRDYQGNELIARLGFIDTTAATLRELQDNLKIGLIARPGNYYEIESFSVSCLPKGKDFQGPYKIIGSKVPRWILNDFHLRSGDKIFFDEIRARRTGSEPTLPIRKGILIKIVE